MSRLSGDRKLSLSSIGLATLSLSLGALTASAESWSYGVMTDTQGAAAYPDVSTRLMAPVVDQFVNVHGVDMIISVGDLTDTGTVEENALWLSVAQPIYDAGIPIYIQRGNHDVKTESTSAVNDPLFGPVELNDSTIWDAQFPLPTNPLLVEGPGTCYYFTFNNMFVISMDLYGVAPSELIGWLQSVALPAAAASGADHRVLVQHAPYFGKGRDGIFQGASGDPEFELQLLKGMAQAGVDTILVGHDHQYSRSVALDTEGEVLLNHILVGSNSEKYYNFEMPEGDNEGQVVQMNGRVSYCVVEVDGPQIVFNHYSSEAPDPYTTDAWIPNWVLSDRLVYSTEGDRFFVEPNADYAGLTSTSPNGTQVEIVSGTNDVFESQMTVPDAGVTPELVEFGALVDFSWLDGTSDPQVLGDILVLDGLANTPDGEESELYRLEMTYAETVGIDESTLTLAVYDPVSGTWMDARLANIYDSPTAAAALASAGVDTTQNKVWAELNHNADGARFAVVSNAASLNSPVRMTRLGSYESGIFDGSATEIPAYDAATQRVFVTNAHDHSVDVIDLSNPATPVKIGSLSFADIDGQAYSPNSVAVKNGIVAVALQADTVYETGIVAFYDAAASLDEGPVAPVATADAGYLPDMLTFTPDGLKVLVANEGEASDNLTGGGTPDFNPEGSVTIIPINGAGASVTPGTPVQLDFSVFEPGGSLALGASLAEIKAPVDLSTTAKVRIHPNAASVAQDLEPEYIAVAPDGGTAYVGLQENNAILSIDLATDTITGIFPLGAKNHSLLVNALDAEKNDDAVHIVPQPFFGLYMPDAMSAYTVNGQTYIVTANEGDGRDPELFGDYPGNGLGDEADLQDAILDETIFPNRDILTDGSGLGDVGTFSFGGDLDNDGDVDQIQIAGARSFSIWNASTGELVFDSGGDFERITAQFLPDHFNASNDDNAIDDRSDNKGPEPEAVQIAEIGGRQIAFVALERVGGVMIYDITDPTSPLFIDYVNDRDFTVDAEQSSDIGPEGFAFVPAAESPNGHALLLVASEVSGSLTAYQIDLEADSTWNLTLLHHNDGESKLPEYSSSFPDYGNVARMKTAIDAHRSFYQSVDHGVVVVYAGDSFLAGKQFQASVDSEPQVYYDALALSHIGYDAIAIGNHEFDFGPEVLAAFIEDAQTTNAVPYLSANLDFTGEPALQALVNTGDIVKSKTITVSTAQGDKVIGLIGATTVNLPFISSPGAVIASEVAAAVNAEAAALASSTDAIILISHLQGVAEDEALASLLSADVNAIIAGGGDEILGSTALLSPRAVYGASAPGNAADSGLVPSDSYNEVGLSYPTYANGIPIATTGGNYGYLGRLTLRFDADNHFLGVDLSSGPAVIVADSVDAENGYALDPTIESEVIDKVVAFTHAIDSEIIGSTDSLIVGGTDTDLIRSQEQNGGNLVADALLAAAQERAASFDVNLPQIAIANGGGIRSDIAVGAISVGDTFDVSPFGNFVSVVENVTTADLKLVLENALSRTIDNDPGTGVDPLRVGDGTGRFPQLAGMTVTYDITRQPLVLDGENEVITQQGQRVIEARLNDGTALIIAGIPVPGTTVDLVLPSFNADGGDQYFRYGFGAASYTSQDYIKTTLGITDQQALQNYIASFGMAKVDSDTRYDSIPDGRVLAVSDRDNDGLSDAEEALIGTNPDIADQSGPVAETYTQAGKDAVTSNPSQYDLFTQSELNANYTAGEQSVLSDPSAYGLSDVPVAGLRIDGQVMQLNSENQSATFEVQVQSTTDLTQPFTNAGDTATVTLDFSVGSQFIRVQAVEQAP
ncbi:choice-of-anchor I family protein [Coraliomargarita algicola]|uniref:Choice-of-anchor I family protein n=1 Tax=Coraliomargarita algicola TaxID=3092156 RepID=A0ABZ0RPW1_9BACT|nr:choice-of-anchor I family protein [Coraliomargarita sp. J2-16]WPJ97443.1 choice-of-anchor I family protein [Coraliomargarita sp. J2-16]